MISFTFHSPRVLFGPGSLSHLEREIELLGVRRALVISTPHALRDLGMPESSLDRAAEMATTQPYPNPRPLERRAVRQLLQDGWEGRRPGGTI
jgi:alcohol dehydrogenase class IV